MILCRKNSEAVSEVAKGQQRKTGSFTQM